MKTSISSVTEQTELEDKVNNIIPFSIDDKLCKYAQVMYGDGAFSL